MKYNNVLKVFAFMTILPLLGGWTKNDAIDPNMIITDTTVDPIVRYGEQGEVLKLNDPNDAANSKLTKLEIKNKIIPLFFNKEVKPREYETAQIELSYLPHNANISGLVYASSDDEVATVDENGIVTAKGEGICNVTVTTMDGSITSTAQVVVNDSNMSASFAQNRKNTIQDTQNSSSFVDPEIVLEERVYESTRYQGEGTDKPISRTMFTEKLWASQKYNYFRIVEEEQEQLVEGGSLVPYRADYIFYTTDDFYTYIFKTDGNKRNYLRLDQSSLVEKGLTKFDALKLAIGNFFTAGAAIIERELENSKGLDLIKDSKVWSGIQKCGYFQSSKGQLQVVSSVSNNYQVGDDQEDDFNIPARTPFTVDDKYRAVWEDNVIVSKSIDETWAWNLDNVYYHEENKINYFYQYEGVELVRPSTSMYQPVDSIFDL